MTLAQKIGWGLSVLLVLFMVIASAGGKLFYDFEGKDEMFPHLGFTLELMKKIGVLEIIVSLIFLVPQSAFIGAILVTGYLGGATVVHLRVGDPEFFFPIVLGILFWIALGLRDKRIFQLAMGGPGPTAS